MSYKLGDIRWKIRVVAWYVIVFYVRVHNISHENMVIRKLIMVGVAYKIYA